MIRSLLLLCCLFLCQAHAQIITTFAGNGANGFSGNGGQATSAALLKPYDVGIDSFGNVYIGDAGNNRIRRVSPSGIISTVAGLGVAGYNGDGISATLAKLNFPYGMSVNGAGAMAISDMNNHRIRLIQAEGAGGNIATIAGTGVAGFSGDGGPAINAKINTPHGIFWDLAGNIYFADAFNHRVRKISTSGIITTVAGNGNARTSGDGGLATAASINHPAGIAADSVGNLYISEMKGHRIRKVDRAGIITTIAGKGVGGLGGDGGPATAAKLYFPKGVTIDKKGNLIFTDTDNFVVRKVNLTTGIITTIAGTIFASAGVGGYGGDGGPATAARLDFPQGVFVDKYGNLYIGDCLNHRVRKITYDPANIGNDLEVVDANIFPNPAQDELNITAEKLIYTLSITNVSGKVVMEVLPLTSKVQLNISELPAGDYIVAINGQYSGRFLKQ